MKETEAQEQVIQSNENVSIWVLHVLVAAMVTCLSIGILQFARQLVPGFDGSYLPVIAALISIEALISWRRTRRWSDMDVMGMTYWVIEWVVLMVFIRVFLFAWRGQYLAELNQFGDSFLAAFFDGDMWFASLIGLIVWAVSGLFEKDIIDIEGDVSVLRENEVGMVLTDRRTTRRAMVGRVFGIGFLMVALVALTRIDFQTLNLTAPRSRLDVANLLVYFLLSLAFFSQTNYAALRGIWAWNKIPVSKNMAKRWFGFSLVFLVVVAILAFLLPTNYTMGLLSTLKYAFDALMYLAYTAFVFLLTPLLALIGWLMQAMRTGGEIPNETPPEPPLFGSQPERPVIALPWLEVLKSILFWGLLIGITGYAFYQYARQNKALVAWVSHVPVLRWLGGIFGWMLDRLRGLKDGLEGAIKSGLERARRVAEERRSLRQAGFVSLRRMTPRQRVIFFYLALVRRGAESGLPRRPDQTPIEYAHSLEEGLQGAENELEAMTDSFLEARYSLHEVTPEKASTVRQLWDQVKRRLRRIRPADSERM
jgi:hypothetical protein